MFIIKKYILVIILFASLVVNGYFILKEKTIPFLDPGVKVVGIIDGDTIVVDQKTRVRLRHIDAPEKGLCGYEQAQQLLRDTVVGKKVTITEIIPDQYGRGMGLVSVGNTLVNETLLASGWVRYHSDNTSKTTLLKTAVQKAKDEKRGIYGECQSFINNKQPTCTIKGNIDKNSYTNNRKYYVPSCAQYAFTLIEEDRGEQWFCSEKEALKAGFIKAETCGK